MGPKVKKRNKIGFEAYYTLLTSKDGMPISKPPWGTISSIDLITGDIDWKILLDIIKIKMWVYKMLVVYLQHLQI